MICWVMRAVEVSGIQDIVIVINPRDQDLVRGAIAYGRRASLLSKEPIFVVQPERRGSAEAVLHAIPALQSLGCDRALITYGDMPMWSPNTIRVLCGHAQTYRMVTLATVERAPDYPALDRYGRVVYDDDGSIARIIEVHDPVVTPQIQALSRVNPSLWVWQLKWLQQAVPRIAPFKKDDGYTDELHLPPLIAMAASEKIRIGEVRLSVARSAEALGANSLEELQVLKPLMFT